MPKKFERLNSIPNKNVTEISTVFYVEDLNGSSAYIVVHENIQSGETDNSDSEKCSQNGRALIENIVGARMSIQSTGESKLRPNHLKIVK